MDSLKIKETLQFTYIAVKLCLFTQKEKMTYESYILFWSAIFGGAIGSFLNVVVYRLPLGMSLRFPGSHCPKCGHKIRWHDNIPVFGWGILGGKCRDCKEPISFRYPFVEALCSLLFLTVFAVFLFSSKSELPIFLWQLTENKAIEQKIPYAIAYAFFMTVLLALALIEYDKKQMPLKLYFLILVISIMICCISAIAYALLIAAIIYAAIFYLCSRHLPTLSLWIALYLQMCVSF